MSASVAGSGAEASVAGGEWSVGQTVSGAFAVTLNRKVATRASAECVVTIRRAQVQLWLGPQKVVSRAAKESFRAGAAEKTEQAGIWKVGESTEGHWCVWRGTDAQLCVSTEAGIWRCDTGWHWELGDE